MTIKAVLINATGTYTFPSDFTATNTIIAIGAGGGGSTYYGGGGGGCSIITNVAASGGSTFYVSVGTGGSGSANNNATAGGDTWLNLIANSSPSVQENGVLAKGGGGGAYISAAVGSGGSAASGVGSTKYSGGNGGTFSQRSGGGGGGAAGVNGAGSSGGNANDNGSTLATGGNGGNSDADNGGAGGLGAYFETNGQSSFAIGARLGGNGIQFSQPSVSPPFGGSGGGGGGGVGYFTINVFPGRDGGRYGGGGGGAGYDGSTFGTGGAGASGLVIILYEVVVDEAVEPDPPVQELFFSEAVKEMLAGRNVNAALGVWFDFASEEMRVWLGRGTFIARDGTEWSGLGEIASIDGMQSSPMLSTEPVTMTLSGLDASIIEMTRAQASEIRGRRCGIYILMFDENAQPIDEPYLVELYLMDKASFTVDGETRQMTVSLTAEPLFSTKHVPRFSLMTDQDQQLKYPGDGIFKRVQLLAGRQTVVWSSDT